MTKIATSYSENGSSCAVVVTYNRKDLLAECIQALLAQDQTLDAICLVDNASTDGTPEMLFDQGVIASMPVASGDKPLRLDCVCSCNGSGYVRMHYLRMPANIGGAGGFYEGMRLAYEQGYDWVWVMDDDTIPTPSALREMFAARERFPHEAKPNLLASKVLWSDGTVHPMNAPVVKVRDPESILLAAEHATVSLRSISFVSVLISRDMLNRHGLPIKDFFIWNDDAEYTARLLKDEFGVAVPASVVNHKSTAKYVAMFSSGPRYYYEVRNKLWCLLYTEAWTRREKLKILGALCESVIAYLNCSRFSWESWKTLWRGLRDGAFTRPSIPDGKLLGWSECR